MKSLKIKKGVIRKRNRRRNITMVEGKKNNDLQAYQQKLKIAQREPY
jgi:hypothetical protein